MLGTHTSSPYVGLGPHAITLSSATQTILAYEQATSRTCHPTRSGTGLGYMVASPARLFWPQKYNTSENINTELRLNTTVW